MARKASILSNTENATFSIGQAKVRTEGGGFEPTDDESGTGNRPVFYTVRCKTCKEAYTKSKTALAKQHTCPTCGTKHPAAQPKANLLTPKRQTILALSDTELVRVYDNKDNAIVNQTPADYIKWHNFGRKTFVSHGHLKFTLDDVETGFAGKLLERTFEEFESASHKQVDADLESHLADLEGYHVSLESLPKQYNLLPHNPKRVNFEGWLVSTPNAQAVLRGETPLTDAKRAQIKLFGHDLWLQDPLHGMSLTWICRASAPTDISRGWVYVYRFPVEFTHKYKVPDAELEKYDKGSNTENIRFNHWVKAQAALSQEASTPQEPQ